jgi:hypothetical protein
MTQDYEVEVQARAIGDDVDRKLFCRNFGNHWSEQYKRSFQFLQKKVEKGKNG